MSFRIEDILKKDDTKKIRLQRDTKIDDHYVNFMEDVLHCPIVSCYAGGYNNTASCYHSTMHYPEKHTKSTYCHQSTINNNSEHCKKCLQNEKDTEKPSSSLQPQTKRRVLFTKEQTYELEKVFQTQQYLTVKQREHLSNKIYLSSTQVKIWFQNHRYKLKKYLKRCLKETPYCRCEKWHTQSYKNRNSTRIISCTYSPLSTTKFSYT